MKFLIFINLIFMKYTLKKLHISQDYKELSVLSYNSRNNISLFLRIPEAIILI